MQLAPLIVRESMTLEERYSIIMTLSEKIQCIKKTRNAYYRLFGTQLPHVQIERLIRMNSRALNDDYNQRLFRILSQRAQSDFYQDDSYIENHYLIHAPSWDDGKLIARWEKFTKKPNPHHIIPESRGGSNSKDNFWYVDRPTHDDFHTIFPNLTPSEQITVLLIVNKELLSKDFTNEIHEVLQNSFKEPLCYKKGVLRKGYEEDGWSENIT